MGNYCGSGRTFLHYYYYYEQTIRLCTYVTSYRQISHRHWRAVSFCQGLTTATLYYMVLQPAASRRRSMFRMTEHVQSQDSATGAKAIRLQASTASAALATSPTADHLQVGCTDVQYPQHIDTCRLSRHITARNCRRTPRSSTVSLLSVPFHRTNFSRRAFHCSTPTTWNSLPHSVRL